MNDKIATQILKVFANNPFTAFNHKQVSSRVGAYDKGTRQLVQVTILEMAESGILVEECRGKYKINPKHINDDLLPKNYLVGTIDMKQTGKAYVIPKEEGREDVMIAPNYTRHALHGDTVKVLMFPQRKMHKPEGQVVEIIQRAKTRFVGRIQRQGNFAFLLPDTRNMVVDIFIPLPEKEIIENGEKKTVVLRKRIITRKVTTKIDIDTREKEPEKLMPTAKAAFQVLEGTKVRVNMETSGPLLEVFEKFETYVEAWNPEREIEYGLFRTAIPEFDKAAFREGLINAFCHRDYTMLGTVRVLIDDEGMTISSPGGFIDGVTIDNLLTVEPHGKNPALADALKRIGLAEKTGRGIDRIYEGSIIYGRPWPDFSETTSTNVKLFIQRAKADDKFTKLIADEQNRLGKPLSIYALMILSLLKSERRMDIARVVNVTHLSEGKIRSSIENLIEDGLIEGTGSGKSRTYMLSSKVYKESNKSIQYVRQTGIEKVAYPEMILKLARTQDGIVTKQDIAELLMITPDQAYSEIKKLVAAGKLYKYCGGKYTKYKAK